MLPGELDDAVDAVTGAVARHVEQRLVRHMDNGRGLEAGADAFVAALRLKPERHHFNLDEAPQILRFMNATGG